MQTCISTCFVLISSIFPHDIFLSRILSRRAGSIEHGASLVRTISPTSLLGVTLNASEDCLDVSWEALDVGGPVLFDLSRGDGLREASLRGHLTPERNHSWQSTVARVEHT